MSNVKYLRRRVTKKYGVRWDVSPPDDIQKAVGMPFETFSNHTEAKTYAEAIADAYDHYKRTQKRQIYIDEHSVTGLVSAYKSTNAWNKLSDNTKRTYNQLIQGVMVMRIGGSNTLFKDMLAANVRVRHAEAIYSQLCEQVSMHRANHTCKVLRRIWFVGKRLGSVQLNPFEKMGLQKLPDREVLWEPQHVKDFIDAADFLGWPSIGTLALLCYDLCQRPGDMRQLTWECYQNGIFSFKQEKTNTPVEIPASPRLVERLKDGGEGFIVKAEDTQRPYDRRRYNKIAARVRREAKLPAELQLRDLRRTGATEMAEAGCTEDELRSVTGHQSRDVLSIYVRPTKKLAAAGINKRFQ